LTQRPPVRFIHTPRLPHAMAQSLYEFIGTKVRPIELASILKSLLQVRRKFYRIKNKFWYIDPVSNFGIRLLHEGEYEPQTTDLIIDNLNEGDTFIDLGGNEGYYSILASDKVGKRGKVFCIEPQSRLWDVISKNINKNECYNVCILPYAVAEKREEISITLSPSINTGSSSIVKQARRKFWKRERINCATLDELFPSDGYSKIELLKIDIEGFEFFALKGAIDLLKRKAFKNIIVEFHPSQLKALGQSADEIYAFLDKYGYTASQKKPLDENLTLFTCESNDYAATLNTNEEYVNHL
jgi:FkbM family methyltransferase